MSAIAYLVEVVFAYVAIVTLIAGSLYKLSRWTAAPKNLPWGLYPTPDTGGQLKEILEENLYQKSVLKYNRQLWFGTWAFHVGLNIIFLWLILLILGLTSTVLAKIGGALMFVGLIYLLIMRSTLRHVRILSSFQSYFNLLLLLAIVISGAYVGVTQAVTAELARSYLLGILTLNPVTIAHPAFLLHLLLVEFFAIYFPFSPMFHMVSKFFTFHGVKWSH